jgi:hypothetical protein
MLREVGRISSLEVFGQICRPLHFSVDRSYLTLVEVVQNSCMDDPFGPVVVLMRKPGVKNKCH